MSTERSRPITTILSLILPGLGQIYKGQSYKTILGYSLLFLLPLVLVHLQLIYYFPGFLALVAVPVALYFLNVFDAIFGDPNPTRIRGLLSSRWAVLLPVALLAINVLTLRHYFSPRPTKPITQVLTTGASSMEPTLEVGDYVVSELGQYDMEALQRQQVIHVLHDNRFTTVRIIGIEGDAIRGEQGRVYVNEELLVEPYLAQPKDVEESETTQTNDFGPYFVPDDHLFVLGDNRLESRDSRHPGFGFVHFSAVKGRPFYIVWSRNISRVGTRINPGMEPAFELPKF